MLNTIDLLLRNRFKFFKEVKDDLQLPQKIRALIVCSLICFALFGAVLGSDHSVLQTLSSAAKLPLLFLVTLLVCLPTLYFFNSMFEADLSFGQNFVLLLSAIAMTGIVLLAFVPVSLFFLITTSQYQFYKVLNVAFIAIAGVIGVRQLVQGMKFLTFENRRGARARERLLTLWIVLYGFVGTQLAWTLRPFFGAPGLPFELFRGLGGNFYTNLFASLGEVFGFFTVR